jgi:hypothetical protein
VAVAVLREAATKDPMDPVAVEVDVEVRRLVVVVDEEVMRELALVATLTVHRPTSGQAQPLDVDLLTIQRSRSKTARLRTEAHLPIREIGALKAAVAENRRHKHATFR